MLSTKVTYLRARHKNHHLNFLVLEGPLNIYASADGLTQVVAAGTVMVKDTGNLIPDFLKDQEKKLLVPNATFYISTRLIDIFA